MTTKERREMERLNNLWATRRATMKQMDRCMELNRRDEYERLEEVRRVTGTPATEAGAK